MRGLDPRIHQSSQKALFRRAMDRRVEPGDDAEEDRRRIA
jgi:hypothetical protein